MIVITIAFFMLELYHNRGNLSNRYTKLVAILCRLFYTVSIYKQGQKHETISSKYFSIVRQKRVV